MAHARELRLCIEYWPIDKIVANPKNAKQHPAAQIKEVARSIEQFENIVPGIVDESGVLLAGHARLAAVKYLGRSEMPVIRVSHLTETERAAFAIADNKLAENGTWDQRQLAEILQIIAADITLDVEVTGFAMAEIDLLIESQALDRQDDDAADQLLALDDRVIVSKPGDLWLLNDHCVLCGDSLQPDTYAHLMQGQLASMVFSDPPYNLKIPGNVSGLGKIKQTRRAPSTVM